MFSLIKFIAFLFITGGFGFVSLSQLINIRSLILLIPLSITFGISSFVFFCHSLSFILGPQNASVMTLILFIFTIIAILFFKRKNFIKPENEITNIQSIVIYSIALLISLLTFIAVSKYGTFDRESHMPIALTMFHNNVYPPRDCFRPDYVLLYHYGGDLLAGAIYHLTGLNISTSYEMVSTLFSGVTFLSFFSLAWLLSKNFKLSFIAGFCTYFGGGLLWLDAIMRYITKNFPEGITDWTFLQTFLSLGIHGGINNAPSVLSFISTFNMGNPLLVFCLILIWLMIGEKSLKATIPYIIFLNFGLFTLFLTTDWLYVTFWAAVFLFLVVLILNGKKQFLISIFVLLLTSVILNKSIGNALFLQDPLQNLGRTNIFDIGIKENLFTVVGWGRLSAHVMNYQTISCFSWDFVCELGITLFLFPIAIIYVIRAKNLLAYLLFFTALATMPVPPVIDFKLNPVELVRLFAFGNVMLILLITCGIDFLYKNFFQKKALVILYMLIITLSPVSQLLSGAIISPHIFSNKTLTQAVVNDVKSIEQYIELIKAIINTKNRVFETYKSEINFFKSQSKPKDVAISSIYEVPAYSGVYSLIPPRRLIYWDQLYSPFNSLFETIFSTLDVHLLTELNIKWILITSDIKNNLPKEIQAILNNKEICELAYTNTPTTNNQQSIEIYHINDLRNTLNKYERKTAWLLINKIRSPIYSGLNKIALFPSLKEALFELKNLQNKEPNLKKELITAQPVITKVLEGQILTSMANIVLEKRF